MFLGIAIYFWIPASMLGVFLLANVSKGVQTGVRMFRGVDESKPFLLTLGMEILLLVVMAVTSALNEYHPRFLLPLIVMACGSAAIFLSYWLFEPIAWATFHLLNGLRGARNALRAGVRRKR